MRDLCQPPRTRWRCVELGTGCFVDFPFSGGVPPSLTRAAPSLSSPRCTDLALGLDVADAGQSGEPDQRSAICRNRSPGLPPCSH